MENRDLIPKGKFRPDGVGDIGSFRDPKWPPAVVARNGGRRREG